MSETKGEHISCSKINDCWLNELLDSKLNIYRLRCDKGINRESAIYRFADCALICDHTYNEDDNYLVADFINRIKPLYVMVINDIEGECESSGMTRVVDKNSDYKIIKRMTQCRDGFDYITTVYSTDKSIVRQECIEREKGDCVEWNQ